VHFVAARVEDACLKAMNIEATIELSEHSLVWPQTATCRAVLFNGGDEVLGAVNRRNRNAAPSIVCRDTMTGEVTVHADTLPVDYECPPKDIAPGESLAADFPLSRVLRFPGCGVFEIAARYDTVLGPVDSEPVAVEVLPAAVRHIALASTRGSLSGDIYAAWVDDDPRGRSLWLTTIGTNGEGAFSGSRRICAVDGPVGARLSVPANTIPTHRFAAWIEGRRLYFVRNPGEAPAAVDLGAEGCQIVAPLFEDPWADGRPQFAEALLLEKGSDSWRVRIAVLSDRPFLSQPREYKGVAPEWCGSVYRSGGERYTFFVTGPADGAEASIRLGIFSSKLRSIPGEPVFPAEWSGRMIAADVALTADDRVVGAVLAERELAGRREYTIHKWHLDRANELSQASVRLSWNPEWPLDGAVVRVNDNSAAYALINGGPAAGWFVGDAHGAVTGLGALAERIGPPADIVFLGGVEPAILFSEPGTGLRLHYLGAPRVERPRG
jgi:hypothetical protein